MNTSIRIKEIIKVLNLNNSSFSKALGVSNTTIDGYIKGRKKAGGINVISQPNFEVIKKISEVFSINPSYILGLSDEMFLNKNYDDDKIIRYIIENDENLMKNSIFREYIENKRTEIEIEIEEEKLKLKKRQFREVLLKKLKND